MEKIKEIFAELKSDPRILKQIYAVTLAAALLVLVLVVKGPEEQGRLVTDARGNVVSISRHSQSSNETYDVTVTVGRGSEAVVKDVTIGLRGIAEQGQAVSEDRKSVV